ncbi:MAG: 50S ribosomal protein L19e [Candidatus Marsarchaeota archaeon]|nr:50S ribosomal protein L19e [Candidatus Marsarchaeota archaeon]MCL5112789.1 50S ribosomal protein L19e [Candidatus Marsarchaeota archaeon]
MSMNLTRRVASRLLKRGESSIRIKPSAASDAKGAISAEDVRNLIKKGDVYAVPKKRNLSLHGKERRKRRDKGRSRGKGRRKGTYKARVEISYTKKIRGQRRILKDLKQKGTIDNAQFTKYYLLAKGGTFVNKVTLINRLIADGISISSEEFERLRHI